MNDLLERITDASAHVSPRWTLGREQAVLERLESARRWRRVTSAAGVLAAVVVVCFVGFRLDGLFVPAGLAEDGAAPMAAAEPSADGEGAVATHERVALQFEDGSRVRAISAAAEPRVVHESAAELVVALEQGHARFEITPDTKRRFRVVSSPIVITVLGTVFDVTSSPESVHVAVERGLVRVDSPAGSWRLAAGEAGTFARTSDASAHEVAPAAAEESEVGLNQDAARQGTKRGESPTGGSLVEDGLVGGSEPGAAEGTGQGDDSRSTITNAAISRSRAESSVDEMLGAEPRTSAKPRATGRKRARAGAQSQRWANLAGAGAQAQAYEELKKTGSWSSLTDITQLMLAADVARDSGDFKLATAVLGRVVTLHPKDGRAPLAAFTMGKLLLERLGSAGRAAQAFARVRQLAPQGPLAEDALAREVEALARSGDVREAGRRAELYFSKYPKGRRRPLVERYAKARQ